MGFTTFTSDGQFQVPCGVSRVQVLAVGGGSGGGSGNAGGGPSGFIKNGEFAVEPGANIAITVGVGGAGSTFKQNDPSQNAKPGGRSSFGLLLSADGGGSKCSNFIGAGSSGGGQGCEGPCWSGTGGSSGSNGNLSSIIGQQCLPPGSGQGTYEPIIRLFKRNLFTAGAGGKGVFLEFPGGGGAGGILLNGIGPSASIGQHGGAYGGNGYGAGGGGGLMNKTSDLKGWNYHPGGRGASGLIYIEWGWNEKNFENMADIRKELKIPQENIRWISGPETGINLNFDYSTSIRVIYVYFEWKVL